MAYHIYPTETPVGSYNGDLSDRIREYQLTQIIHDLKQSRLLGHRLYLGTISAHSPNNLSVDVAAGYWCCYGRQVQTDAVVNVTGLTGNATNYIFLQLTFTGSLVTSASFTSNTTGTPPSYSVCVGKAVCGDSTVTSVEDVKANPGMVEGTFTGNSTANRLIFLGYAPSYVQVSGDEFGFDTKAHPFQADGSTSFGYNDYDGGRSTSAVYVPIPATLGFTVSYTGTYGLNYTGKVRYYRAFA